MSAEPGEVSLDLLIEWGPTTSADLPSPTVGGLDLAIPEHLWAHEEGDGASEPESPPEEAPAPVVLPPTTLQGSEVTRFVPAESTVSGSSGRLDAAALDALLEPARVTPAPRSPRSGRLLGRLLYGHPR